MSCAVFRKTLDIGCYQCPCLLLPAFAIWCQTELQGFVDTFSQQVFGRSAADIGDVAECVRNAHNHCRKVRSRRPGRPGSV